MVGRGCSKRHTVGCTDDLSPTTVDEESTVGHPTTPSAGGTRTRRTGLLTVMERPPGTCSKRDIRFLVIFVEITVFFMCNKIKDKKFFIIHCMRARLNLNKFHLKHVLHFFFLFFQKKKIIIF